MNDLSQARAGIEETLGVGRKKRSPWRRRLIWGGIVLAVLLVGYFFLASGGDDAAYKTEAVKRGPLSVKVTATGTLQPIDQVEVGAEVSGRVVDVKVDFNTLVKKNDILAQIDTTQLEARRVQTEAQLAAAKAGVREAEASLSDARRRLDRLSDLRKSRTVSQQDLDTAQANYERALASLEVAKAQVALQEAALKVAVSDIDKAIIRAPIDGIVLYRSIEPGQTVAASFETPVLFTLASDIKKLELLADIDEADVGQVQEGQTATFTVDAFPNRTFDAQIRSLRNAPKKDSGVAAAAASAGVVIYQGELTVNNEAGLLKPGMTATAEITVKTVESALLVPNAALRFVPDVVAMREATQAQPEPAGPRDPSAGRVFVDEGGAEPVEKKLKIGVTDGAFTEVLSGELAEGDMVLTDLDRAGSGAQ
ncbi:MAG: efflux RND transporter periplasmic adaptor subunit [Alphaproteobacteria bacterium]|nr:efflux RND transporter periplasmic adaptor subunit [Alphaproteobacteria bacterium]